MSRHSRTRTNRTRRTKTREEEKKAIKVKAVAVAKEATEGMVATTAVETIVDLLGNWRQMLTPT
jgi:hypothetical protein